MAEVFHLRNVVVQDGVFEGIDQVADPVVGWGGRLGRSGCPGELVGVFQVISEVTDVIVGCRTVADEAVQFGAQGPPHAFLFGL